MGAVDTRNPEIFVGGSDQVGIEVLVRNADFVAVFPDEDDPLQDTWVPLGYTEGGSIAHEPDAELDRDEAMQIFGQTDKKDDFVKQTTVLHTGDTAMKLLDLLSKKSHRYRYPLPAGDDGGNPAKPVHQLYGMPNGWVERGYQITTKGSEKRVREVTVRGSKIGSLASHVRETVDLTDDANWPVSLNDYKDAAVYA